MTTPESSNERIDELESRIAHQDATIDKLNEVVTAQWTAIDRVLEQLRRLEQRVVQLQEKQDAQPVDQVPPHY